jgi:hypothetical protein
LLSIQEGFFFGITLHSKDHIQSHITHRISISTSRSRRRRLTPDHALIPETRKRKRWHKRGQRSGTLTKPSRQVYKSPLPSILLVKVQSLENKLDKLCSRLSYQPDLKNCNILCFTESWLNKDMDNIQYQSKV